MNPKPTQLTERAHESKRVGTIETHSFTLEVPANLAYFEGHFPSQPILPGFVTLREVLRRVHRLWPDLSVFRGARTLKFRNPIRPRARIRVQLSRADGQSAIELVITSGDQTCAQGQLEMSGH